MMWLSLSSGFSSGPPARPDPSGRRSDGLPEMLVVIEIDASQEGVTMVITGEVDLTTRSALAEQLSAVLRTGPRQLILDLAGATFMDCGSARLIVGAGRFLPEGGRLIIRSPSRAVRRVLELTRLDAELEIEG
jgi:anti-anti-sigma factor